MDFPSPSFGSFQGRIKTLQVFNAKAQKVAGKWQVVPNSEIIETDKVLDARGNEIELKLYNEGQLSEYTITSYATTGNLLKRQVFRPVAEQVEAEETEDLFENSLENGEATDSEYEEIEDEEETENEDETEAANADTDSENNQATSPQLLLVEEEEYVYDEFNFIVKSRTMSKSSDFFGDYDETTSTTYNQAGKKVKEIKDSLTEELRQTTETVFNEWENPIQSTETHNGILESNTVYVYNQYQQEISRLTVYADHTTEELIFEYDQFHNVILGITSQRDGTATAIINKIVYY